LIATIRSEPAGRASRFFHAPNGCAEAAMAAVRQRGEEISSLKRFGARSGAIFARRRAEFQPIEGRSPRRALIPSNPDAKSGGRE